MNEQILSLEQAPYNHNIVGGPGRTTAREMASFPHGYILGRSTMRLWCSPCVTDRRLVHRLDLQKLFGAAAGVGVMLADQPTVGGVDVVWRRALRYLQHLVAGRGIARSSRQGGKSCERRRDRQPDRPDVVLDVEPMIARPADLVTPRHWNHGGRLSPHHVSVHAGHGGESFANWSRWSKPTHSR